MWSPLWRTILSKEKIKEITNDMPRVKVSVYVPTELHRRAKYVSFEEGTTIQHVVENALQKALDPDHRPALVLRPKEMQTLFSQLRAILGSGNELFFNNCVSCIRGTYGLLLAEKRAQAQVVPIAYGSGQRQIRPKRTPRNPASEIQSETPS